MPLPADVLILQDRSASMVDDDDDLPCGRRGCGNGSKWSQVTAALTEVVTATQSSIKWGLKFSPTMTRATAVRRPSSTSDR
jgi:hypothetical protein